MIGEKIAHYVIIGKLGSGGMGEVYLALDTVLNRRVAVKVLSRDLTSDLNAVRYFRREARAAATLDHPNICTIHEVGEENSRGYIVMQHVEGETLAARIKRQPLHLGEVLSIACQLADALATAHLAGVIHRDIKPHNIMLTPKGQLKVLDFGLATVGLPVTAPGQATGSSATEVASGNGSRVAINTTETLSLRSEPGELVGTLPYMSPEQVRREALDVRTDVFSFGSVIVEALTGKSAFLRETPRATMEAIRTEPVLPLAVPGETSVELQRIVRKCLEKERDSRYDSARELFAELDELRRKYEMSIAKEKTFARRPGAYLRLAALLVAVFVIIGAVLAGSVGGTKESPPGAATGLTQRSIAVLPLKQEGDDPTTLYLSDGITASLINQLSQLSNLKVISRNSAFRYKGQDIDPQTVGRELNVEAVLTGSIEQRGENLSVFLVLSDASRNRPVWGRRFVSKREGVLELQSDILRAVTEALRPQSVAPLEAQFRRRSTENIDAYNLYLKGMFHLNKRSQDGLKVALESFHEALRLDPNYALAHSGLADAYSLLDDFSMEAPVVSQPLAEQSALRALAIDPDLAEAHSTLGLIYRDDKMDWPAAERELKRALEINPNYALTHNRYGWYLISLGRFDEALMYMRKAQELDPRSLNINTAIGLPYLFARNYDKAVEEFQRTLQLDPEFYPANLYLALSYTQMGRQEEAIKIFKRLQSSNEGPDIATALACAHAAAGQETEARNILQSLLEMQKHRHVPAYDIALIYAQLRDNDQAFFWLEQARVDHTLTTLLKVHPLLDPLRGDPRFNTLLQRVNLAQ